MFSAHKPDRSGPGFFADNKIQPQPASWIEGPVPPARDTVWQLWNYVLTNPATDAMENTRHRRHPSPGVSPHGAPPRRPTRPHRTTSPITPATFAAELAALEGRLDRLAEASAATGNSPGMHLAEHWAELRSVARRCAQLQNVVQAMAARFKRWPNRAPISPRREGGAFVAPQRYDWLAMAAQHSDRPLPWQRQFIEAVESLRAAQGRAWRAGLPLRSDRGPTIGRKRRRRRARGRARGC